MFSKRWSRIGELVRMGVKHLMVSESKSKCGRLVTQGEGADCKNCARVQASQDAWAGKPAADMVAVATDVPGEPEYMTREDYATKVAEAAKPRAKSAKPEVKPAPPFDSIELDDPSPADFLREPESIELPQVGQWIMWAGFSYMVESRYPDGRMALRPYGGYETVTPDRPIAQLMAWGEAKWPAYACKTCGPRSSAWCTKCYECDHWGRPIVPGVESAPIISEGDTVYRDRDGAEGVVSAITVNGELVVDFTSGAQVTTSAEELARNCYEVIPAAEVQATQVAQATVATIDVAAILAFELAKIDAVEQPADPFRGHPDYAGEDWQMPYESLPKAGDVVVEPSVLIESYAADFAARLDDDLIADGTLGDFCRCHHRVTEPVVPAAIKQPIRTCMGRRKRKATKRARKQAHGMKGGTRYEGVCRHDQQS